MQDAVTLQYQEPHPRPSQAHEEGVCVCVGREVVMVERA